MSGIHSLSAQLLSNKEASGYTFVVLEHGPKDSIPTSKIRTEIVTKV